MEIVAGKNESLYERVLSGGIQSNKEQVYWRSECCICKYLVVHRCIGKFCETVNDFKNMTQASLCMSNFQRWELSVC